MAINSLCKIEKEPERVFVAHETTVPEWPVATIPKHAFNIKEVNLASVCILITPRSGGTQVGGRHSVGGEGYNVVEWRSKIDCDACKINLLRR